MSSELYLVSKVSKMAGVLRDQEGCHRQPRTVRSWAANLTYGWRWYVLAGTSTSHTLRGHEWGWRACTATASILATGLPSAPVETGNPWSQNAFHVSTLSRICIFVTLNCSLYLLFLAGTGPSKILYWEDSQMTVDWSISSHTVYWAYVRLYESLMLCSIKFILQAIDSGRATHYSVK